MSEMVEWPESPHFRDVSSGDEQRASFLELFFDLVYVFAVTQLAHHLLGDLSWRGVFETTVLLLVSWWAWIYTTWMANWFDPEAVPVRLVLMLTMLFSLLMAVAIPGAFDEHAMLFAGAYVALQVVRNTFIVAVSTDQHEIRPSYKRILAWSIFAGVFWIAGALPAADGYREIIWLLALGIDFLGPLVGYWTPVSA